jgi:hypothetical protein
VGVGEIGAVVAGIAGGCGRRDRSGTLGERRALVWSGRAHDLHALAFRSTRLAKAVRYRANGTEVELSRLAAGAALGEVPSGLSEADQRRVTQTSRCANASSYGVPPTWMVARILPLAGSIRMTVPSPLFATQIDPAP